MDRLYLTLNSDAYSKKEHWMTDEQAELGKSDACLRLQFSWTDNRQNLIYTEVGTATVENSSVWRVLWGSYPQQFPNRHTEFYTINISPVKHVV